MQGDIGMKGNSGPFGEKGDRGFDGRPGQDGLDGKVHDDNKGEDLVIWGFTFGSMLSLDIFSVEI